MADVMGEFTSYFLTFAFHCLIDEETLEEYADEVRKRLQREKDQVDQEKFLRSSLRESDRLKAIEKYHRILRPGEVPIQPELNEAFEYDESGVPPRKELAELIKYLQTKLLTIEPTDPAAASDADQWEWLLSMLADPLVGKAYLMHDNIAVAYEGCHNAMAPEPRHRWPVLAGLAYDTMEALQTQLLNAMQQSVQLDAYTMNHMSNLHNFLAKAKIRNLLIATDGLANTWQLEADNESDQASDEDENSARMTASGYDQDGQPYPDDIIDSNIAAGGVVEESIVPGCYATLAYDENGRDSYSEQGIRLKYVVFQKGDNEYLGATVRTDQRSILVARIVNGGLAQKTDLLHEGDELIAANGQELIGKDLNTVTDILASLRGRVVILVAPASNPYAKTPIGGIIHLRALFSYEPMEDRYLACRQLGLAFSKGDIIHVTGRRDPNWWQAYRSDEQVGLTGAIGTLAGLVPSPAYQRQRAIIRLQSWLSNGTENVELEDEPSDVEDERLHRLQLQNSSGLPAAAAGQSDSKERRIFGFRIPTFNRTRSGAKQITNSVGENQSKSSGQLPRDRAPVSDETESDESRDVPSYVGNTSLLNSIYGGRLSGQSRPSMQMSEGAIDEWSAAGPVWGQHGYEIRTRRARRRRPSRKDSGKLSLCLDDIAGKKRLSNYDQDYFPSLAPVPPLTPDTEDPVGWLDEEVSRGFLRHSSLWTYEPMAQYIPQPLRRRPLVFVGPAHVGRHQLMQRLIELDSHRFCAAPIHTTNATMKSDSSVSYVSVSEEIFETKRKQHEFVEWGVFNRAKYGTSKSTLRQLIEQGKVCCITLRPDSLRQMRTSGLLPYVIFISPPERVDELRRVQKQLGLTVKCSDQELKSCIEISRKMELRFGHWFDLVIVPETLESTVNELSAIAMRLEREPSWIPRYWL